MHEYTSETEKFPSKIFTLCNELTCLQSQNDALKEITVIMWSSWNEIPFQKEPATTINNGHVFRNVTVILSVPLFAAS